MEGGPGQGSPLGTVIVFRRSKALIKLKGAQGWGDRSRRDSFPDSPISQTKTKNKIGNQQRVLKILHLLPASFHKKRPFSHAAGKKGPNFRGQTILDKEKVKLYEHILSIIIYFYFFHFTVDPWELLHRFTARTTEVKQDGWQTLELPGDPGWGREGEWDACQTGQVIPSLAKAENQCNSWCPAVLRKALIPGSNGAFSSNTHLWTQSLPLCSLVALRNAAWPCLWELAYLACRFETWFSFMSFWIHNATGSRESDWNITFMPRTPSTHLASTS